MGKRRYNLYMSDDILKEFKKLCVDLGVSMSVLIEQMVKERLNKNSRGEK